MEFKNIKLKNKVSIKNLINDETKVELFGLIFVIETLMIMITLIFPKSFIASLNINTTIDYLDFIDQFMRINLPILNKMRLMLFMNKKQYEFLINLAEKEYNKKVDVFYHIEYCSKEPYIIDEKEEFVFITMPRLFTNLNFREDLHDN